MGALGAGPCGPDDLGADLPELAVASALRALAAELRADVEELLQQAGVGEFVLDVGADYAGGVLGAEGEGLGLLAGCAGAVFPGVHLLGDDVGLLAYSAGEELGGLKDGGADLAEAVAGEDGPRRGLDAVPQVCFGRQQVAGAAYCFQNGHRFSV